MFKPFLLLSLMAGCMAAAIAQQPTVESSEQAAHRVSLKVAQADQSLHSKDYGTAIVQYQAVLQDPAAAHVAAHCHYYLGRAFLLSEKYAEALASYQQVPSGKILGLAARYEMGKAFLAQGNPAQAATAYRWLLEEAAQATNLKVMPEEQIIAGSGKVMTFQEIRQSYCEVAKQMSLELADRFPSETAATHEIKQEPYPAAVRPAKPESTPAAATPLLDMGKDGATRPTITYKEKAKYTEIARINRVQGTVVLNVVFSVDGEIKNIRVVRGLEDGLLRQAIIAATKIRFQPATRDGQPVSTRGNLEYSFNLY